MISDHSAMKLEIKAKFFLKFFHPSVKLKLWLSHNFAITLFGFYPWKKPGMCKPGNMYKNVKKNYVY